MKLKFLADAFYRGELKYKKDEVKEVSNKLGEADRWLKRNLAVEADEKADKKPVKKKDKPRKEDDKKKGDKKADKKDDKKKEELSL